MTEQFKPSEWAVVLPERRGGIFASPYLEPVAIVTRETGADLSECIACGQFREGVEPTVDDGALVDVCADCRQE